MRKPRILKRSKALYHHSEEGFSVMVRQGRGRDQYVATVHEGGDAVELEYPFLVVNIKQRKSKGDAGKAEARMVGHEHDSRKPVLYSYDNSAVLLSKIAISLITEYLRDRAETEKEGNTLESPERDVPDEEPVNECAPAPSVEETKPRCCCRCDCGCRATDSDMEIKGHFCSISCVPRDIWKLFQGTIFVAGVRIDHTYHGKMTTRIFDPCTGLSIGYITQSQERDGKNHLRAHENAVTLFRRHFDCRKRDPETGIKARILRSFCGKRRTACCHFDCRRCCCC